MTNSIKIAGIALLVIIAGVAFMEYKGQEAPAVACTMEAKICPDGSAVGRTGPMCEFAACPEAPTTTVAVIGKKITVNGVSVTPVQVVEDSRCPIDVQCIQAGTVRLQARLESEGASQDVTLTLNQSIAFAGKKVVLDSVTPAKVSTTTINPSQYTFHFSVTDSTAPSKGILKGSVSIGPVCPQDNSAGYSCTPTPEMYAAAKVFVYKTDKRTLVTTITPDAKGNFSVDLPSGSYFVDMIHQSMGGTTGVPATITINAGQTYTLKLAVDTGLR